MLNIERHIVKPVLRGHLWKKENMVLQDRWSLKRGSNHMNFSMTGQEMWPFNTGDCFIEVTTWAGLTVYTCCVIYNNRSQSFRNRIKFACMQHKTGWNMAKIACMRPPETGLCNAHLADTKSYNTRLAETRTKIHYFKHYMIHWNQDQNS